MLIREVSRRFSVKTRFCILTLSHPPRVFPLRFCHSMYGFPVIRCCHVGALLSSPWLVVLPSLISLARLLVYSFPRFLCARLDMVSSISLSISILTRGPLLLLVFCVRMPFFCVTFDDSCPFVHHPPLHFRFSCG